MADHNKPVLTSTYANFVGELDARFDDLSVGLDPAVTSATNLPVNAIRWNSVLAKDQKWNGSAWTDKSSFYVLGSVRFNNGTVSAPSITFSDDNTTGIFKPTPTSVAITTLGVEVMRTNSTNVLVGTTVSDGARMHINASSGAAGLTVGAVNQTASEVNIGIGYITAGRPFVGTNTSSNPIEIGTRVANPIILVTDSTERARVSSAGNLLVGTSSDVGSRVNVFGESESLANIRISGVDGVAQPSISLAAGARFDFKGIQGGGVSFVQGDVGERMRITNTGNLMLGTTTDTGRRLEVSGDAKISSRLDVTGRIVAAGATGNAYTQGSLEIYGGGLSAPSTVPTIGFHNPEIFAGSLRQNSSTDFGFYRIDGNTPADLTVGRLKGVADQSNNLKVTDPEALGLDRNIAHITPQSLIRNIRADFAQSATTGTGGNYAGVVTLSPYEGTTASTGGPSYQLAFGSSQANGGSPQLRIRNGIDTTWNAWVDVMTPAGAILHFAMSTSPAGYLKANGAAVSRTAYNALFDAIGTTFGAGDGSTTFNLPDLRGEFIRGWDDTRGVDSGRIFGSFQSHAMQGHQHTYLQGVGLGGNNTFGDPGRQSYNAVSTTAITSDGTNGTPQVASETRPRNIALLACIKY